MKSTEICALIMGRMASKSNSACVLSLSLSLSLSTRCWNVLEMYNDQFVMPFDCHHIESELMRYDRRAIGQYDDTTENGLKLIFTDFNSVVIIVISFFVTIRLTTMVRHLWFSYLHFYCVIYSLNRWYS